MNSAIERARSERARSRELQKQSELVSQRLVDNLRGNVAPRFGQHGDTFVLRLARIRPTVAFVRHALGRWLEGRDVAPDHVRDLTLAASEACANAVEHPLGASDAAFEITGTHRDDEVTIVVRDSGRWRAGPPAETRGRGMQMLRSLMDDVELVHGDRGTKLVMRRRLR